MFQGFHEQKIHWSESKSDALRKYPSDIVAPKASNNVKAGCCSQGYSYK